MIFKFKSMVSDFVFLLCVCYAFSLILSLFVVCLIPVCLLFCLPVVYFLKRQKESLALGGWEPGGIWEEFRKEDCQDILYTI